jgi:hypothetical protein
MKPKHEVVPRHLLSYKTGLSHRETNKNNVDYKTLHETLCTGMPRQSDHDQTKLFCGDLSEPDDGKILTNRPEKKI